MMKKHLKIMAAVVVCVLLSAAAAAQLLRGTDLGDLTVTGVVLPAKYGETDYGQLDVYFRAPEDVTLTAGSDACTVTLVDGETVAVESTVSLQTGGGGYHAAVQLADKSVNVAGMSVFVTVKRAGSTGFYDTPVGVRIPEAAAVEEEEELPDLENLQPGDVVTLPKEMTLAEVKPRYGIEKKINASGVIGKASFIDGMDAYMAQIPYASNTGGAFTLTENIAADSSAGKKMYVTFTCLLPASEPQIQNALSKVKLLVSYDGKTYVDSGVSFTAEKTGEKAATADGAGGMNQEFDVYRFTSGKIELSDQTIRNIKVVPQEGYTTTSATQYFRLLSLYVWADTGEKISVPVLEGFDLSQPVTKTTANGVTEYGIYSTKFADTNGWATNCISYAQGNVRYQSGIQPYTYFDMKKHKLPVTDGREMRLYSPDMELELDLYDSVVVKWDYFRDINRDPVFDMMLGYSTDDGATWTKITDAPDITQTMSGTVTVTYQASLDLKKVVPAGTVVTNVVILPYNEKNWYTVEDTTGTGSGDTTERKTGEMIGADGTAADGAFRILDFSITGYSSNSNVAAQEVPVSARYYDSMVLQKMLDDASAAGEKEVTIPGFNPRTRDNTWVISKTILVPSDMTLYLNNCTLRWEDFVFCRMMQNAGAGSNKTAADEDQNIHIIGVGDATMQGGVQNGLTTPLISGLNSGRSTWDNIMLLLHNVNHFSVENIRIEQTRFWGVVMLYCRNGRVEHMDYYDSRPMTNGLPLREQDGIDVRNGCENIVVNDITGRTGDDNVALNAIRPLWAEVSGKHGDIKNITVTNINTRLVTLRMQVRLTATNGWKIHDVLIDGVYDTHADFGGDCCSSSVRIGDKTYGDMSAGDINNIYLRNIRGDTTNSGGTIHARHSKVSAANWAYEYETCSNTANPSRVVYDENTLARWNSCTHSWTEKVEDKNRLVSVGTQADCMSGDVYKTDCSLCPAVSNTETYMLPSTGPHTGGATCTKQGVCSLCGTSYYLAPEDCAHDGEATLTKIEFNGAGTHLKTFVQIPVSAAGKEWTYSAIMLDSSGNVLTKSYNTSVSGANAIGPDSTNSYVSCTANGIASGTTVTVVAEITIPATGKVYGGVKTLTVS